MPVRSDHAVVGIISHLGHLDTQPKVAHGPPTEMHHNSGPQAQQQQQHLLLMQQLSQQQHKHAGVSPFSMPANQFDDLGKPLARCSCPGLLVLQESEEDSDQECMQLTSMLSSSWCDSSMSISRQSCSTASMRSFSSSPLQHLQDLSHLPIPLYHQQDHQQQQDRHVLEQQQQLHKHTLHQHQQLRHHQHQQHSVLAQAASCTPCSPCCSAASSYGDLCCCKVVDCSSTDNSAMSLSHSSCRCAARAGSNSSTQSSNTNRSDSSHCSTSTEVHAACATDPAEAAAGLLCRTASSASSAWSNKSHHVASRPGPGGDLANGMTWVMHEFGGREVLADYEFGQTLGCGTFGVTRLVTHRKTASMWACKTICKASIAASPAAQSDVQQEVAILQHLRGHNGIVQLKGVYEDERNIHLVMDLCTGGDLLDYISRFQRLEEIEAADVASVMLHTLAHCHRLGVVHRDIKPENFLLGAPTLLSAPAGTAARVLKISDFGVSAFFEPGKRFTEIVGTPFYMAPEVLERCYGPEADIWSVGVVVFLMLAGRLPFDGATDRQIIKAVLDSEPDFQHPAWNGISASAKDCVARMLVKDPKQRASVQQLLAHPWLAGRMRSSCCSNAGDTTACGAEGSCNACGISGSNAHQKAAAGCHCGAGSDSAHHLQRIDSSASSSSRVCGVSWATPCATELDSSCASPRQRRDSSPTLRKPVLSPLKHVRSRADLQ